MGTAASPSGGTGHRTLTVPTLGPKGEMLPEAGSVPICRGQAQWALLNLLPDLLAIAASGEQCIYPLGVRRHCCQQDRGQASPCSCHKCSPSSEPCKQPCSRAATHEECSAAIPWPSHKAAQVSLCSVTTPDSLLNPPLQGLQGN